MKIGILGAGAFGSALAIALDDVTRAVTLISRDPSLAERRRPKRLPDATLPNSIKVTDQPDALNEADIVLLCTPTQTLPDMLKINANALDGKPLVACCKGIDLTHLTGPADTIEATLHAATPAILTGPSFAADIAKGLPTALTLACSDDDTARDLQSILATPTLRLYRSADVTGAQLGGALKNVVAIACGAAIGAGLGDSARAAVLTRGFAEMTRIASHLGASPDTLAGLSGLGDLTLTATSSQSRNYRFGLTLGAGKPWNSDTTVEGAATAKAAVKLGAANGIDLPLINITSALVSGEVTVDTALTQLLSRPLREE